MKYIEVYQNGVIKKIPYWDYMMQRVIEHRIRNTSRSEKTYRRVRLGRKTPER